MTSETKDERRSAPLASSPSHPCSGRGRLRRTWIKPFWIQLVITVAWSSGTMAEPSQGIANPSCPSALEGFETHQMEAGETLATVAAARGLHPETLTQANPNSPFSPGSQIQIPPFNGRVVTGVVGESWQSLAERYNSRSDILFEVNGCLADVPDRIFVPGAYVAPARPETVELAGYPLPQPANIILSYGWQPHPSKDEMVFNSGIAFEVNEPATVLAVDGGTVAFAGNREGFGQMVVINHAQGLQTRYINLSEISVSTGQSVNAQAQVGRVGGDTPVALYFEVRTNTASGWVAEDPAKYMPALELR